MKQALVESQAKSEPAMSSVDGWIAAATPSATRYLVRLPRGYGEQEAKLWPVLLFLHGSGERGEDLTRVLSQGLPAQIAADLELPAIVVAPQLRSGESWHPQTVARVLDQVERDWRVDTGRVALTGLSMGGMGALSAALAFPERFCAVSCVAGGLINDVIAASSGLPLPPDQCWQPLLARIRGLPVWLAHGRDDARVPFSCAERLAKLLAAQGSELRTSFYDGVGHDSWTRFYGETPELCDWLFAKPRSTRDRAAQASTQAYAGRYGAPDGDEIEVVADGETLLVRGLGPADEVLLPLGDGDFVARLLFRFRPYGEAGMRLVEPGLGEFRRR